MIFEVSKVLPKNQLTIPKEVRESLKVTVGDRVIFVETKEGFLLKKVDESFVESFTKPNAGGNEDAI